MGSLEILHKYPPAKCPGATELIPGVSLGGFNASRQMVRNGSASPLDFHFFVAYARWTWQQLQAELEREAWIIAACSEQVLLSSSLEDPCADADSLWYRVLELLNFSLQ